MKKNPIGIFDSGIGGLSVVKKVKNILKYEDIIYFGDTARVPYGTKSKKLIEKFALDDVNFLLKFNPKVMIIACHTASSLAGQLLKRKFPSLNIIDVVSSSIKKTIKITGKKRVGVIGTSATISSGKYEELLKKYNKKISVFSMSCPLFVPLVEEGLFAAPCTYFIAEYYLKRLKKKNIDTLILGCTHYPYLKKVIQQTIGKNVKIVDPSDEVALNLKKYLENNNLLKNEKKTGKMKLFFSDISPYTEKVIKKIFPERGEYTLHNVPNV